MPSNVNARSHGKNLAHHDSTYHIGANGILGECDCITQLSDHTCSRICSVSRGIQTQVLFGRHMESDPGTGEPVGAESSKSTVR